MTSPLTEDLKKEHLLLAGVVKGTHRQLRRQFRESNGDYSSVWETHLKDKDALISYANAMQRLAENHWSVFPETRIDWCYSAIVDYFLCHGWKRALEKDAKRKYFDEKRLMQGQVTEKSSEICSQDPSIQQIGRVEHIPPDETQTISVPHSPLSRLTESGENIRLLDVGSCYNAFASCDRLESIGIDLCPANEHVYQCDFLKLEVLPAQQEQDASSGNIGTRSNGSTSSPFTNLSPQSQSSSDFASPSQLPPRSSDPSSSSKLPPLPSDLPSSSKLPPLPSDVPPSSQSQSTPLPPTESHPLTTLPHSTAFPNTSTSNSNRNPSIITQLPGSSFQVVVFCLLLEYLPASAQRLLCCLKAHSLLDMHGLLLIITPDSHSQHKNAPMMKSWKQALEALGFSRWKYEKKEHIHCMAFRKISEIVDDSSDPERRKQLAEKLYIPQDFNDACYDDLHIGPKEMIEDETMDTFDETTQKNLLDQLPMFISLDDNDADDDDDNYNSS